MEIVSNILDLDGIIRPGVKPNAIDFYVYSLPNIVLNPPVTVNTQILTQSDSDFVVMYASGSVVTAAIPNTVQRLAQNTFVQVTDLSDGKTFFNQPVYAGTVFGSLGFPYVLPCPRVWRPNTNINVSLTQNNAAIGVTTVSLAFTGVRIYYG